MPLNTFITYAAVITIAGAVHLLVQSVLEHVQRAEGQRQSLGSDDAGVDYGNAAAA